jgi:hypothetical protein
VLGMNQLYSCRANSLLSRIVLRTLNDSVRSTNPGWNEILGREHGQTSFRKSRQIKSRPWSPETDARVDASMIIPKRRVMQRIESPFGSFVQHSRGEKLYYGR